MCRREKSLFAQKSPFVILSCTTNFLHDNIKWMDKFAEIHQKYGEWPQAVDLKDVDGDPGNLFDQKLVNIALELAQKSPRKRTIIRIHDSLSDEQHLMINAILGESYVRPHKHSEPEKTETFRILKGQAFVVFFDENGNVENKIELNENPDGRKIATVRSEKWHTVIPVSSETVLLEAKRQPRGGYNKETDKDFAPWAPAEGNLPEASKYLKQLILSLTEV